MYFDHGYTKERFFRFGVSLSAFFVLFTDQATESESSSAFRPKVIAPFLGDNKQAERKMATLENNCCFGCFFLKNEINKCSLYM